MQGITHRWVLVWQGQAGRVSQSAGHHTQVGVSVAGPGREGVTECKIRNCMSTTPPTMDHMCIGVSC